MKPLEIGELKAKMLRLKHDGKPVPQKMISRLVALLQAEQKRLNAPKIKAERKRLAKQRRHERAAIRQERRKRKRARKMAEEMGYDLDRPDFIR